MKCLIFSVAMASCIASLPVTAQSGEIRPEKARVIADVAVRDQNDHEQRFYSDLVKDQLVAVNFVFTSCQTVCPLMGVNFAKLQTLLGEESKQVRLISVSIDPVHDTPERLMAWGSKLGAASGWSLVTGTKPDIDTLVKSLGTTATDPSSHTPVVMIIDDRNGGAWQRLDGLANPATIAGILRSHLNQ